MSLVATENAIWLLACKTSDVPDNGGVYFVLIIVVLLDQVGEWYSQSLPPAGWIRLYSRVGGPRAARIVTGNSASIILSAGCGAGCLRIILARR